MPSYPSPRPSRYPVRVGRSSAGLGLYAVEEIPKNRFIIEYWGKIAGDDEANRVGGRYLFDLENGKTILGGTRKNVARYANHACRPNAEVRQVGDRIYIYSIKPIHPDDEITYDYGKDYFDEYITKKHCRCTTCVKKRATRS